MTSLADQVCHLSANSEENGLLDRVLLLLPLPVVACFPRQGCHDRSGHKSLCLYTASTLVDLDSVSRPKAGGDLL